ncbi:PIG-X/PBN1 family protein [Parashewanella hymeniacidonis]|nr:PIG-X/PBN1 family protein [Parashewanella hymeniacidonis]
MQHFFIWVLVGTYIVSIAIFAWVAWKDSKQERNHSA